MRRADRPRKHPLRLGRGNGYPDRLRSVCLTQYHAAVRAARLSPVRSGGWAGADRWSAARRLTKYAAARPLFALRAGRMAASGITRRGALRRRRLLCARADGSLPKWWDPAGGNDFGGNPAGGGKLYSPCPTGQLVRVRSERASDAVSRRRMCLPCVSPFTPCGLMRSECSRRASDKEDHTDADRSVLLVHDCLRSARLTQYHAAECACRACLLSRRAGSCALSAVGERQTRKITPTQTGVYSLYMTVCGACV